MFVLPQQEFFHSALTGAVREYQALCEQGGVFALAAFGVAAVGLQGRLNLSLENAASLLQQALY